MRKEILKELRVYLYGWRGGDRRPGAEASGREDPGLVHGKWACWLVICEWVNTNCGEQTD